MQRFLEASASYIYAHYSADFSKICIVLPNRRSGLFFTAYLKQLLAKPVIGPRITTVNELMNSFSDLVPGGKLKLIAWLYQIFREETGSKETFDDFYFWGEVLLADFDDIDKYRIDADDLFFNLSQLKEIENRFDYLTEEQKRILEQFWGSLRSWENHHQEREFVSLWEKLPAVYTRFRNKLKANGIGYTGMIMRDGVDNCMNGAFRSEYETWCFIGLNALNGCEKALFSLLKKEERALFLWDYDSYYLEDPIHNAGKFIRENLQSFPPPPDFNLETGCFNQSKSIEFVAVPSGIGQAQVIPPFFDGEAENPSPGFDHTAIVLADETLLFPVLGAIPGSAGPVNITMGYPVRNAPLVSFLVSVSALLRSAVPGKSRQQGLYIRLVEPVLTHPILSGFEPDKVSAGLKQFRTGNKIYISPEELNFSEIHHHLFSIPEKVGDFAPYFLGILKLLFEKSAEEHGNPVTREMVYHVFTAIEKLKTVVQEILDSEEAEITPSIFFRLMVQYLNQESVPFEGEPLTGVQVMGILETRCLDFDNLLILGLNEDIWPRTFATPSLIPYNLRKAFGLPGVDDQDAMYAYYFFRLLQRAGRVTATWSTVREATSGGELSRYGFQLMFHSPHEIRRKELDFPFSRTTPVPVSLVSGASVSARLLHSNQSGKALSPSAMISFMNCSLQFYFRYAVGLKEAEDVSEEIDRQLFGNLFHKAAENLYRPYVKRSMGPDDFHTLITGRENIRKCILQAFATEYFQIPSEEWKTIELQGKAILIYSTLRAYLRNLLESDKAAAPLFIHALEESFVTVLEVMVDGLPQKVRIGGKVDRIDEIGGVFRVVDYKTGTVESSSLQFSSIGELFDLSGKTLKKEVLQALTYAFILHKDYFPGSSIVASVVSILNLKDEKFNPVVRINGTSAEIAEVGDEFAGYLKNLVGEIYSSEKLFSQTIFPERCKYCPYNGMCRR